MIISVSERSSYVEYNWDDFFALVNESIDIPETSSLAARVNWFSSWSFYFARLLYTEHPRIVYDEHKPSTLPRHSHDLFSTSLESSAQRS